MAQGLDYSWGRPNLGQVKQLGYEFVVRYLAAAGGGKEITSNEAAAIRGAGLNLALVYEQYAQRPLEGRSAGQADAKTARAQADSVGFPADRPIYFAVDWDAAENQQAAIDDYLRGAADVLGADLVGVYAGYWIVKRCVENGTAKWLWQTYAWSGGNVHPQAHLYQYKNGQNIAGAGVDINESKQADYGAWGQGSSPAPAPAPAPQPAPAPSGDVHYTVVSGDTLGGIASRFGTTYQHLAQINNIANPNLIFAGEVLLITGSAAPAATYTVVRGDTLSGIATRFGTTYQQLAALNNISNPNLIYTGEVLRVA